MDARNATPFVARASAPPLGAGEIHVWSATVESALSPHEIGEAAQLILARLLCSYSDLTQAPEIERSAHGKPFAPSLPDLDFNLSHAGPDLLLAFARTQTLGVDLERRDRRASIAGIAGRFFAPREARALAALPPARQRDAFLRLWTHKEAVLKAIGYGLQFGLHRVGFSLDPNDQVDALMEAAEELGAPSQWCLRRLDPGPGLLGALAGRGAERRVRAFRLIS